MKSQHPSSIICPYNDHFQPMNMMYAEATNALRWIFECFINSHTCKFLWDHFFRVLERNLTLGKMENNIQLLKTKLESKGGKKSRSKSRKRSRKKKRKVPKRRRNSKRGKKLKKKSRSNRLRSSKRTKKNQVGSNRRRGWQGWKTLLLLSNEYHLINWQAWVPIPHQVPTIFLRLMYPNIDVPCPVWFLVGIVFLQTWCICMCNSELVPQTCF